MQDRPLLYYNHIKMNILCKTAHLSHVVVVEVVVLLVVVELVVVVEGSLAVLQDGPCKTVHLFHVVGMGSLAVS